MEATALGRSLKSFAPQPEPQLQLFGSNTLGLPTVYNIALSVAEQEPAILVFVHDDIYLCDFFWMERLYEGLQQFDVIGLAGNTRRVPKQPAWAFATATPKLLWDERRFLSGTVGHGKGVPCNNISIFGPAKQECKLMDGLFLAADSEVLNARGVRFDEQFAFHFYDMDFCRQAEQKGLRMGTWPISVVHESGGNFNSPSWREGYAKYLEKYGEADGTAGAMPKTAAKSDAKASGAKANIFQIFYSEETRQALDPGYIPLDNTGQRPDWCEYWPIRNFLLNHELNEDEFYGFLSPKFRLKTGLSSAEVCDFVASVDSSVDVVAFSPFFDQSALFWNVFAQGISSHPNAATAFVVCAETVVPSVPINTLVTDSTNTIFCNYFLAKPKFWRHWLSKAELIFDIAERNDTLLGQQLNAGTSHRGAESFQSKVFFIERLASLILATEMQWRTRLFDPARLPLASPRIQALLSLAGGSVMAELTALDEIKKVSARTGTPLMQQHAQAVQVFFQKYFGTEAF